MKVTTLAKLGAEFGISAGMALRSHGAFTGVERYVMFIAASRSGHSVVGSLLNAHPNVVISHELNALRYVAAGFRRAQIYSLILEADRRFEKRGRTTKRQYNYTVPGQWQGRFEELNVIGDKEGSGTSNLLQRRPELLQRLRSIVGVPVQIIHVVRNPFDNISTISLRQELSLAAASDRLFRVCDTAAAVKPSVGENDWLELRHEDFVADARKAMKELCDFVRVPVNDQYLDSCAEIIFKRPNESRRNANWAPALVRDVEARVSTYPFLTGYGYED